MHLQDMDLVLQTKAVHGGLVVQVHQALVGLPPVLVPAPQLHLVAQTINR
jgi:hypothetical protein